MPQRPHFKILDAHKTYCPADWQWDHPGGETDTNTYTFWLVTDGQGTMYASGKEYDLTAGDCFLLRRNEPCNGQHDPKHPLTVPWIVFRVDDKYSEQWRVPALHRRVLKLSFLTELVEHAILEHLRGNEASEAAQDSLRVALHLLADQDENVHGGMRCREQAESILQTCERIRREPGRPWTVSELADSCHVSPGHFTRLFKIYADIGPREFITRIRIEAAKALLRMSDHSIGEIAELLGYGDIFHLSRQFREKTGMSPSAYRKA